MKKLVANEILKINNKIWEMSKDNSDIEYGSHDDFPIRKTKLKSLIKHAPTKDIINTATYYMKNIILLQMFADANHRTAFESVRYFFHKNAVDFIWDIDSAHAFMVKCYSLQQQIYGTYEEKPTKVLTEPENVLYHHCKKYIKKCLQLTKDDQ